MRLALILIKSLFITTLLFGATQIYTLQNYANDLTNTLTTSEIESLNGSLKEYDANSSTQIAILIVPDIEGYSLEEYSIKTAEQNGIGHKGRDNGVLLLVNMGAREVRIEVGYGLEGVLTDMKCANIIRNVIIPHFKNGEYFLGLKDGIDTIISVLNGSEIEHLRTQIEPEGEYDIVLFALIALAVISVIFTIYFIRRFTLPPFRVYALFALSFVSLFSYMFTNILGDIVGGIAVSLFLSTFTVMLFMYLVPVFVVARLIGLKNHASFANKTVSLHNREEKIFKTLKNYSQGKSFFNRYKNKNELLKYFDLFSDCRKGDMIEGKALTKKKIESMKNIPTDVYLIDIIKEANKREYIYVALGVDKDLNKPFAYESTFDNGSLKNIKELDAISELDAFLKSPIGVWGVLSSLSFVENSADNGSGGFGGRGSGGGGFRGGGGGFGGGGASGRW